MRRVLLAVSVCICIVGAAGATEYNYTTYDQPFPLYTQLTSENHQVNSLGHMVEPVSFDPSPWPGHGPYQGFSVYDGSSYAYVESPWSGEQTLHVFINDSDQVVAQIYRPDYDAVGYPGHPDAVYTGMRVGGPCGSYFWSAGGFTVIPDWDVHPQDINSSGQVVGSYGNDPGGTGQAFVWDIAHPNSVQDLSVPGAALWESWAEGINDDGFIVGRYKTAYSGPYHYFLAAPVPQPLSVFMLVPGFLGLIALKRKYLG